MLLTSDVGLMSLGAIGVTIAIGVFFFRWLSRQIAESAAGRRR